MEQTHFRSVLLERQKLLNEWFESPELFRGEEESLVRQLLDQINQALDRIDNHSYGECEVCHGEVELHRLEVQPASCVCLDCISEKERAELQDDLYLASKIHRALLPQTIPVIDSFDIAVRSLAAGSVGGDYYDFLSGQSGQPIRIVIADAMGKGLPAGLLMSNLQGALRVLASDIRPTNALVEKLNSWLCRNVPVTKFISLACLALDQTGFETTKVIYTNAGHCPPIIVRSDGRAERLSVTGGVLGVHERFAYTEQEQTLRSGDLLLLYTDGAVEVENAAGEQFDDDRLISFLKTRRSLPADDILTQLVDEVRGFTGSDQIDDDFTAILLKKQ